METLRLNGKYKAFWLIIVAVLVGFWAGDVVARPMNEIINAVLIALTVISIYLLSIVNTYIEIRERRTLTISGYWSFRKDEIDILSIKYIYRYPDYIIKGYGSRMAIYLRDVDKTIRQVSIIESSYTGEKIIELIKILKGINPNVELDAEYQQILEGTREIGAPSNNKYKDIRKLLEEYGEKIQ